MALLLLAPPERTAVWSAQFAQAGQPLIAGLSALDDPAEVTEIACWQPPAELGAFPNLRAVISVGAGVDQMPPLPAGVVLSRTIAPGIEEMVRDWVVMATLMLHREMPAYLTQAGQGVWHTQPVRPAQARRIGILGMGRIGRLVAGTLGAMGFPVSGLSRSGAPIAGARIFAAAQRAAFLAQSDLLICLAPLTAETRGMMDAAFLAQLPAGARLVQAGRGAQLVMGDLRAALDSGQVAAAMLDVTDPEPLPADHWAWHDPRVIVTPHIGAVTDAAQGAAHALAVIAALEAGAPVPGAVPPGRGY